MYPRDDGLARLLETLGREPPPTIPVERLLKRLSFGRVGLAALAVAAIVAPLVAFLLSSDEPKPPVNLDPRVVESPETNRDPVDANLP